MPEISVDIESTRPVIAANLEELRYLVFHGMTGDPGQSAYELAVELGFEGTEAEWLASLNGADGKNYGIVVDGSADNILELKSVIATESQGLTITQHPTDAMVTADGTVVFKVTALGENLTYQWQYQSPGGNWRNSTSATEGYNTVALSVRGIAGTINHDGFMYRCKVTGTGGSVISNAATLTLLAKDDTPTANSTDIVTSGGVFTALQGKQNTLEFDSAPAENSTKPVTSGGVYTALAGKQDALVVGGNLDSAPASGSTNPITSGAVYAALQNIPSGGGSGSASPWVALTSSDFGINSPASGGVSAIEAYYNENTGMVRFNFVVYGTASDGKLRCYFDNSKHYTPYDSEYGRALPSTYYLAYPVGVASAVPVSTSVVASACILLDNTSGAAASLTSRVEICTTDTSTPSRYYVSGYYYTEDLPSEETEETGGES